jgi:hypothetical protein
MNTGYPVSVSWGKETFEVMLIPEGGTKGLKAELEEKTGITADRMKLMPKSKGTNNAVSTQIFSGIYSSEN